ncbi:MAG TPA: DUF4388 domain-containing protein [Thermoanaerobaculia bacterium]|jgi:hypothetical protein
MADAVLHGSIAAFPLPEVLTFLSTTRKSGTLTVAHESKRASLFFDGGALVYAGSNQEHFRLGSILARRKQITREQRERIEAAMQQDGPQFGQLAVQQGAIDETQLRDFLKVQVSEIVYDAFVWPVGTFAFSRDAALPPYAVTISVDLANLIMEGARRIGEWEQVRELLPDANAVFRVVATPKDERITLTAEEWKVLFQINGQRTLEELSQQSEYDALQVYRIVYGLLANQLLEPAPAARIADDTSTRPVTVAESTIRQSTPQFGAESTLRDASNDDTSLLVSSEARLSYSDVVSTTVAQLTIANGDGTARVVALTEPEYLIGRNRENSIQIIDLGVSSFHARIYRGAEGYLLEDLKSRNGTYINGTRVYHASLADGDTVHVGQTDLLYEVLL